MKRKATLVDLAERAGVSYVTVHKALNNKPGVSEEKRKEILKLAEELEYSANIAASVLKRPEICIAVVLQGLDTPNSFFFERMWKAVDEVEKEYLNYKVTFLRFPSDITSRSQKEILKELAFKDDVHGVIINCLDRTDLNDEINILINKRIPVVTVNSDAPDSLRSDFISADNFRIGKLAAGLLLFGSAGDSGKVLVLGGSRYAEVHQENIRGFREEMEQYSNISLKILYQMDYPDQEERVHAFLLENPDAAGVYSNSSTGTYFMCRTAKKLGWNREGKLIGSDAFKELIPYFEEGVLDACIWKNPAKQVSEAVAAVYHRILKSPYTKNEIDLGILMKHNVQDYI